MEGVVKTILNCNFCGLETSDLMMSSSTATSLTHTTSKIAHSWQFNNPDQTLMAFIPGNQQRLWTQRFFLHIMI